MPQINKRALTKMRRHAVQHSLPDHGARQSYVAELSSESELPTNRICRIRDVPPVWRARQSGRKSRFFPEVEIRRVSIESRR